MDLMLPRHDRKIVSPGSALRRTSRGVRHGATERQYDQGCRRGLIRPRVGSADSVA
ncbi:hypothetical protein [Acrocarpospora catenulata]|uniref:hypothetical protein n=1 Tax=Acrocarpospora catenulata TaxID=2836182 RepID=UPI001BD92822|nr:hypothetical protein [Acrocarpospora catenulata]